MSIYTPLKYLTIPSTKAQIPIIAFGTGSKWFDPGKNDDEINENLVKSLVKAIEHGFTHLDTAEKYLTRKEIGEAVKASGVSRNELWITDKYEPEGKNKSGEVRGPYESLKESLRITGLDYVDLFLVHFQTMNSKYTIKKSWKEMELLFKEGLAKNIGVSNFTVETLKEMKSYAEIFPQVHQIEYHPYLQNQTTDIVEFSKNNGILLEAYAPLTPIIRAKGGPLDKVLRDLTIKYNRSTTQILLKWVHKQDIVTVTTSSNEKRLDDILDVVNFDLTDEEVKLITDVGDSYFFRSFSNIPPVTDFDEALKIKRGISL